MKFMIASKIPPGSYEATIKAFLETDAPTPEGLKTVGRWHVPGSVSGWHVVEGADPPMVAQYGFLESSPVLETIWRGESAIALRSALWPSLHSGSRR